MSTTKESENKKKEELLLELLGEDSEKFIQKINWDNNKSIKKNLRNFFLAGNNVHCPICDHNFLTFLPFGAKKRLNSRCPNCNSLERHRLLWLFLSNHTDLLQKKKEKMKLLHVAPEKMLYMKFKKLRHLNYQPADKFAEGYSYPKDTISVDITEIPFEENHFDYIICNHVLEHVPNDKIAISEFFRVLKPGGWAILQVPLKKDRETTYEDPTINDAEGRKKAFGRHDHVRLYGVDYKERLEESGFDVDVIPFSDQFDYAEKFKFGLQNEDIYFCTKK